MSLILVLGAKGLVGQETVHELLVAGHNVIASDIDEIDASHLITSSVYNMGDMFHSCESLTSLDL